MAMVKIYVWHKIDGEIVAVGRPMGKGKCIPLSSEDQSVLQTEFEEKHISALHRTHVVDAGQRALVTRSGPKRKKGKSSRMSRA